MIPPAQAYKAKEKLPERLYNDSYRIMDYFLSFWLNGKCSVIQHLPTNDGLFERATLRLYAFTINGFIICPYK